MLGSRARQGMLQKRHPRSSSSEILASGNRRVSLEVACWNASTMLRAGLENIKQEMKRVKINILKISQTRWPEDNDFGVLNSE